ncbi:MAG: DNA methyltransferase [Gemmatimonadota bacterium]|nr:DNA methyltransferase [Gemmatimonadota bacterium]
MTDPRERLRGIRTFPSLVKFLREELDWPIDSTEDFEELTFDYTPEELGIDPTIAAKIDEIKRLRPLVSNQPWGVFFVKFEPKELPVVALRRILNGVVVKKRATASAAEQQKWATDDLLFISSYGEDEERRISFAHFSRDPVKDERPTLKVLAWDDQDTPLHIDDVARRLVERLSWPASEDEWDDEAWRDRWRSAFELRHREVVTTSKVLATRLAELARAIRIRINAVISIESEDGPVTGLMSAFREALVHDLGPDDFADMYAQTIAYGLLSARVANPSGDGSAEHLPVTNPFLKELMETFLHIGTGVKQGSGIDFDELGVSEVVELLDDANMEAVVRDFGDKNPLEDPVIHFYELFLKEYDAKKRMQRGVFYTPRPVVSYIVRSVHELLQTELGLTDGLADNTTWGEMAERNEGLAIPEGVKPDQPLVQILDPATGTGTFLVEVVDVIHRTMLRKWKTLNHDEEEIDALWNEYVAQHLLPRIHGYELLMAPYAIAHLKIGLKLHETGYHFGADERARIYLTNALEPASDLGQQALAGMFPALAHEAQAVNDVKRSKHFTVVVGNPPYSIRSANLTREARDLISPFKLLDGEPIVERGALQLEKNLNDDYVKFFGLLLKLFSPQGLGIAGLITNHAFIDNPTFRGFRWSLLANFSQVKILDLHGNSKKKEAVPDGVLNENVFDIQQGVAVSTLIRFPTTSRLGSIVLADNWGTREAKYRDLSAESFDYKAIDVQPALYTFTQHEPGLSSEYASFFSLREAMPLTSTGIKTHRDAFVIDFDEEPLRERVSRFRSAESSQKLMQEYGLADTYGWSLEEARRRLRARPDWKKDFQLCLYRPFDVRHIYYHSDLVELPRRETMQHLTQEQNVSLLSTRQITSPPFTHVLVTRLVSEMKTCSHDRGTNYFPLYLAGRSTGLRVMEEPGVNFSAEFLDAMADALSLSGRDRHGLPAPITANELLSYAYATFHSPEYRRRYVNFLKTDFPRIPLPGSRALFHSLADLGARLVALHLLESSKFDDLTFTYTGPNNPEVGRVGWSEDTVWLDAPMAKKGQSVKRGNVGFHGVSDAVWNFEVGGYQVCRKWLKDRRGRTLSEDEIAHYQKIVVALSETIRLMQEIDEVIEERGGWPSAFAISET